MKYLDEYRSEPDARRYAAAIARRVRHPHTIMEVCGGQTHNIIKFGIDQLLPPDLTLVHGPGCPVCVTPIELIDYAVSIAREPGTILASFGDMMRVPGSETDLLGAKAAGADVRMVYSPLDALSLANKHPERHVVFFGVGFETTAPANAMAVWQAAKHGVENFSLLTSHVLVPPAMDAILSSPDNTVEGFLAAGHVCAVMGYWQYEPIAAKYQVPIVVTGFEPLDLLQGIHLLVTALEECRFGVENQYTRAVTRDGNPTARGLIEEVFEVCDQNWRGIGGIPHSGLRLRERFARHDAEKRFALARVTVAESPECIAGDVLRGVKRPPQCPAFGGRCTPDHPLGAPMVSSEGACAAYHRYGRAAREPLDLGGAE